MRRESLDKLPDTASALVLRTDFSDDASWETVCSLIQQPVGEFRAYVDCVSDPRFEGIDIQELVSLGAAGPFRSFAFVADRTTLTDPEYPVLVVDLYTEPGRTFRVTPTEVWAVENNLSLANMDFAEFAAAVDTGGVFRGFSEGA
jgi:hypothetical protein